MMKAYEYAAAIEPGTYTGFTGYVLFCGTEAWVEQATFELVEAFDYDKMEGMLASVGTALDAGSFAKVRISDGPYVDWKYGTWIGGTWKNGLWHDGTWRNGIWKRGVWMAGDWLDGTWENGMWYGGRFLDGTFMDGLILGTDGTMAARIWNRH